MKTDFTKYSGWTEYNADQSHKFLIHVAAANQCDSTATYSIASTILEINHLMSVIYRDLLEYGYTTNLIMQDVDDERRTVRVCNQHTCGSIIVTEDAFTEQQKLEVVHSLGAELMREKIRLAGEGYTLIPHVFASSGGVVVDPNTFNSVLRFYNAYAVLPLFTYGR